MTAPSPPDRLRLPELPADLRGPLATPRLHHPETWGPAASQLSIAAPVAGLLLLLAAAWWPRLAPSGPVALLLAALAAALLAAVALAGRRRGGLFHPRLVTLGLALAAAGSAVQLGLTLMNGQAPGRLACSLPLAFTAAAGCLGLRLVLARRSPLDRLLGFSGVLGLAAGVAATLALRGIAGWPGAALESALRYDGAGWCSDAAALASSDLRPAVIGADPGTFERLAALHRRLAASPAAWQGLGDAELTTCEAAAAAFATLLDADPPAPAELADPAFEHAPRPAQAGVRTAQLTRDPAPARQLYGELGFLSAGLAARLGKTSAAAARLAGARATFAAALGRDWLDGWLLPSWLGAGAAEPSTLVRLLAMPGQPPARIDQWLQLSLADARRLAVAEPACTLREPYDGEIRRQQVLDCGLLGVSAKNELDLVGELGLVYSSPVKASAVAPPLPIAASREPDSLRLLIEIPRGAADTAAAALLSELDGALAAAGGHLRPQPGGAFELDFGGRTIRGDASTTDLPGERLALQLAFRFLESGS